jgi:WD40 repeat protein
LEKVNELKNIPGQFKSLFFDDASQNVYAVTCLPIYDSVFRESCSFLVWDLQSGTHKVLSPADAHRPAAFTPDGTMLAFVTPAGLQVWDAVKDEALGQPIAVPSEDILFTLAFHPDRRWLLAGACEGPGESFCYGGVIIGWDLTQLNQDFTLDPVKLGWQGFDVQSLAIDRSGDLLASGGCIDVVAPAGLCPGGEIKTWALEDSSEGSLSLAQVGGTEFTQAGPVSGLAFGTAARRILAAKAGDNQVSLYEEPVTSLPVSDNPWLASSFTASRSNIAAIDLSASGRLLVAGGGNTITLWELEPNSVLQKIVDTDIDGITDAVVTKDGRLVSIGESLSSTDLKSGQVTKPEFAPLGYGYIMLTSTGDPVLWSLEGEGLTNFLFDSRTGRQIAPPLSGALDWGSIGSMPTGDIAISPDGRYAAGADYSKVALWDIKGADLNEPLAALSLEGALDGMSLAFSPDGKYLAAGGHSGGVIIWNVADRTVAATVYPGASTPVSALAFTPDGQILASAVCTRPNMIGEGGNLCDQSEIRLWDLNTHQPFGAPLPAQEDMIRTIVFDTKGEKLLVFPFHSQGYQEWDFKISDWLDDACQAVGRNFTRAEWDQYFPGETYRPTCPQIPAVQ